MKSAQSRAQLRRSVSSGPKEHIVLWYIMRVYDTDVDTHWCAKRSSLSFLYPFPSEPRHRTFSGPVQIILHNSPMLDSVAVCSNSEYVEHDDRYRKIAISDMQDHKIPKHTDFAIWMPPNLFAQHRHTHDIAEHVRHEWRHNRAGTEEEPCAVETEQGGIA